MRLINKDDLLKAMRDVRDALITKQFLSGKRTEAGDYIVGTMNEDIRTVEHAAEYSPIEKEKIMRKGEWRFAEDSVTCTACCGKIYMWDYRYLFCPLCGAKMFEEERHD